MKHIPLHTRQLNPSAPQPNLPALWSPPDHDVYYPTTGARSEGQNHLPRWSFRLSPRHKTGGDLSTTTQLLGIPVASSGYLHPVQLLETGLSCLVRPTLFLLRSRLALCLSPLALFLFLQWKNCWLPARGRAAHRDTSFTEHPTSAQVLQYLDISPQVLRQVKL